MSGRNRACDSSFRRITTGQSPISAQVWANVNSPPVPSTAHRYAATCLRRSSAALRLSAHRKAMPRLRWLSARRRR